MSEAALTSRRAPDFEQLFDLVPVPLMVLEPPEWRVIDLNQARLALTGFGRQEQLGRRLFDLFPDDPNDAEADGVKNLTASLARVMATKRPDAMPVQRYSVRNADGAFEERWWHPLNTPILDEDGAVIFVIHQVEEVTDFVRLQGATQAQGQLARDQQEVIAKLRAAEADLRTSEEFNRRILASSADCIKVLNLQGGLEFMSEGGMCVMEVDDFAAVKGAQWPTFWEGKEHPKAVDALAQARRGETGRFQGFARTMKGSPRWWDVVVTPIIGDDGGPEKLLSVSRDVTAARQAEARAVTLAALGDLIRDVDDPAELAYAAAELLGQALGVSRAGFGKVDTGAETITIERDWNAPGIGSLAGTLHFRDYGSYIEDLKAGRTVIFSDAEKDPRTAANAAALKAISAMSVINMPVTEAEGFVALLYLNHAEPREWTEQELSLVQDVAQRTRVAMERRRIATELQLSEARLRAVLDAVPVGLIFADAPSGRITGGNVQAERIFGHAVLPSPDVDRYDEWVSEHADGPVVDAREYPLSKAIAGEAERPELEVLYHRGDGGRAFVRLIASPIRDEGGRITGGVVASLDIDREKRAEADLRALNDTLERQVERRTAELDRVWRNSRDLLVVVGADGVFRAINPAWTQILGHEPADVVGRSFEAFIWPEDAEKTQGGLEDAAAARDLTNFENRYTHKDGSPRWISWRTSAEGDLVYAYGRDITAEKQQAEALEQAQEALRQSQKMEAMGSLTGGVAHDFNNLLTPIIGSLDMLHRKGVGSERERRLIDGALQSAERAKTLVQRLLAFARRQPLQPTAVDVERLVEGMVGLIGSTLGPTIDLRTSVAPDLAPAKADPNQLEMALLNLAVNARDAMPDGGELSIAAARASVREGKRTGLARGDYVRISVADTGIGMDEATLRRAVEPFFSTKGIGKGTGLGLSMAHGLAAQLGGGLTIDSAPGRGTTIELWLPVSTAELNLGPSQLEEALAQGGCGTALVVDDEELVRMSTADMLADMGYQVVEAHSGEDALRIVREGLQPDLLLTDHLMPGMTGAHLVRELRVSQPELPALIVSGYAEAEGIDPDIPRLTKPFRNAELAASLASLAGAAPD